MRVCITGGSSTLHSIVSQQMCGVTNIFCSIQKESEMPRKWIRGVWLEHWSNHWTWNHWTTSSLCIPFYMHMPHAKQIFLSDMAQIKTSKVYAVCVFVLYWHTNTRYTCSSLHQGMADGHCVTNIWVYYVYICKRMYIANASALCS